MWGLIGKFVDELVNGKVDGWVDLRFGRVRWVSGGMNGWVGKSEWLIT